MSSLSWDVRVSSLKVASTNGKSVRGLENFSAIIIGMNLMQSFINWSLVNSVGECMSSS